MIGAKDALLAAAIDCSHHIEGEKITLEFCPGKPGKNALNQLSVRLEAAFEACAAAHLTRIAELNGANARQAVVIAELRRADEVAHARSLQQAQIIATLANQKAELELQLAAPRGTDAQILRERALTAEMISGCIGYGYSGDDYPPDSAAWLRPFYAIGAKEAKLESQLAAETGRLDFVLGKYAYCAKFSGCVNTSGQVGDGYQLIVADEEVDCIAISGEDVNHPTPRAAIDAAIGLAKGGA